MTWARTRASTQCVCVCVCVCVFDARCDAAAMVNVASIRYAFIGTVAKGEEEDEGADAADSERQEEVAGASRPSPCWY